MYASADWLSPSVSQRMAERSFLTLKHGAGTQWDWYAMNRPQQDNYAKETYALQSKGAKPRTESTTMFVPLSTSNTRHIIFLATLFVY